MELRESLTLGKLRTNSPSIPSLCPGHQTQNFTWQSEPVGCFSNLARNSPGCSWPLSAHRRVLLSPPFPRLHQLSPERRRRRRTEAMSAIENLPNEILTAILSFLPTASLQRSLLISHRFRALTELLLYTSVSIQEAVQLTGSQEGGPYKTWRWCRTILERPHLVHCVKSLAIKWFSDNHVRHANHHPYYARPAPGPIGDIDLEPVFVELATILPNLSLLESLELQLPTPVSRQPDSETHLALGNRLLRPTSFPNLTCLAISGLVPPPQFFLPSSCPSLTTLRFSDIHELPYPFPYDALPNLSSFKGSPATAAVILPGRPVRSLSLVGPEYLRAAEWEGISQVQSIKDPAYHGIETLDLSGMTVTPNLLRDVARWIPTVKDLKIRLALRHTLHHGLGGIVSVSLAIQRSERFGPLILSAGPPHRAFSRSTLPHQFNHIGHVADNRSEHRPSPRRVDALPDMVQVLRPTKSGLPQWRCVDSTF